MSAKESKVDAAAKVQQMVQAMMNRFISESLGPESSAFCLGVCFSGVVALFQKHNPEKSPKELEAIVKSAFLKGCNATVIPITKTPPPQH